MPNLRRIGREAEDAAADYLLAKGFTLVTRRFKASGGELDLVCMDGETLVFVEVKERRVRDSLPEESIGALKAARMKAAALEYALKMGMAEVRCRFDMIAIDGSGLRHHEDVFSE
ncbi:MAG: YraN family protein [Fimbriimonadaceae bacterium]